MLDKDIIEKVYEETGMRFAYSGWIDWNSISRVRNLSEGFVREFKKNCPEKYDEMLNSGYNGRTMLMVISNEVCEIELTDNMDYPVVIRKIGKTIN